MNHLYAPWRSEYSNHKGDGCVFCNKHAASADEQNFIIHRFTTCFVILNLYPYNAGHMLIIPYDHTNSLEELTAQTRSEMMEIATRATALCKKILNAEGVNMGLNLGGRAAGGSIPEHVHLHVLPRWLGDTNFLVTLAETKQISIDLHDMYKKLAQADWQL
jgi:ATP adenylyltransferase